MRTASVAAVLVASCATSASASPMIRGALLKQAVVRNATLKLDYFSEVYEGNLLPQFLFLQGESDGLSQELTLPFGGGRGEAIPFVPDDSCDDEIFEGASKDLRSPQMPYAKFDRWGCERAPKELPVFALEDDHFRAVVTPQFGGKIWTMYDKVNERDFFYSSKAHQPANIGATGAWVAGGLEFNWSPGYLGHSAFSEKDVWLARLATNRGDVLRAYEFDRYNGTVWQVDMLLDNGELWTHTKITNPSDTDVPGYWWTCAAHKASEKSRILAPAPEVTVETYVGAGLRNAPWPDLANGFLNVSFAPREVDSSYLGNMAYTGDYFLRVPAESRKWIGHTEADGYVAMHGHAMNGTKFFTWGQSGPGRFMQDFLAGGEERAGDYTELQAGVMPTQQQVFELKANSSLSFTEYYKAKPGSPEAWSKKYDEAISSVKKWWDSEQGVPESRVAELESFFAELEDRRPKAEEILHRGSAWGALEELREGRTLAPGAFFELTDADKKPSSEAGIWHELLTTGGFSESTLASQSAPKSYVVAPAWRMVLEKSAEQTGGSWLHDLLLGVAYAEQGELTRPKELFARAAKNASNAVAERCLAVLAQDDETVWAHLLQAWNFTEQGNVNEALQANLLEEMTRLSLGSLGDGWASANSTWLQRLRHTVKLSKAALQHSVTPDSLLQAEIQLAITDGAFDDAADIISAQCFPTFGRHRGILKELWDDAQLGKAEKAAGRKFTGAEAHRLRKSLPAPRHVGCPYATQYCEDYW